MGTLLSPGSILTDHPNKGGGEINHHFMSGPESSRMGGEHIPHTHHGRKNWDREQAESEGTSFPH